MSNRLSRKVVLLWLFVLFVSSAAAQTTAGIRGSVVDQTGAAIPNAAVSLTNVDTNFNRSVQTDQSGTFTFTLLPLGNYRLTVEATGFKNYEQSGITLNVNQVLSINTKLEVGNVNEKLEVNAAAPLVNTETTEVGTLIGEQQIAELPLNGRNPVQLATLTSGITTTNIVPFMFGNDERFSGSSLSVNGNRTDMTQFNLDGIDFATPEYQRAIDYPNPDALQEFRFITSNYSAEFGKNPGGIMNVVTKSGTNQYHGDAWEFNRNSTFGARSFFLHDVAFLNQNQFGFDVGGPVIKNKLFLFGTAQWYKIRQGRPTTGTFPPTAAERTGDFSGEAPIIDPTTNAPFPNNRIPANRLDPIALKMMSWMQLPNDPSGQFIGSFPEPVNNHQYMVKGDYNMNDRSRLAISYYRDVTNSSSALGFGAFPAPLINITGPTDNSSIPTINAPIATYTYTFRPNLVNQVRFGYLGLGLTLSGLGRHPTLNELTPNFPAQPAQDIPGAWIEGRTFYLPGNFGVQDTDSYQFSDSVNYIRGKHNIQTGVQVQHVTENYLNTSYNMGEFISDGHLTGNALADFELGRSGMCVTNTYLYDHTQKTFAAYIQDDVKLTREMTLNVGLRYQLATPWVVAPNIKMAEGNVVAPVATFVQGEKSTVFVNAPVGLVFPGDPGVNKSIYPTDKKDWGPRIGFAWDIFGDGKTSLRAGYGLFYTTPDGKYSHPQVNNPPFLFDSYILEVPSFENPLPPAVQKAFPIPYGKNLDFTPFFPMGVQSIDPHYRNANIQQFNLMLQRQLPGRVAVQAGYVGNITHHLLFFQAINSAVYIPGTDASGNPLSTVGNTDQRRILNLEYPAASGSPPFWTTVGIGKSVANSAYHSLQLEARKEFSNGLNFLASYTYSKAIDEASILTGEGFGAGSSFQTQNPNNLRGDRGLAQFDLRQRFISSFIYTTPSLSKKMNSGNQIAKYVLDNWELSGIVTLQSGFPFTVSTGRDNSLTGNFHDRPDLIGDPYLSTSRPRAQLINEYFNTAAFQANTVGTFGDVGRDTMIGPGFANMDFSLDKNLPISERLGRLQLRLDFFNFLNRPNFSNPSAVYYQSTSFGKITSAGPGRIIQIGAKYRF